MGSKGGVSITSTVAEGKVTNLVTEINKNTEFTGITATENTETGANNLKRKFRWRNYYERRQNQRYRF